MVESDDEEVLELKDRLAAYNLDSSPDQTCKLFPVHVSSVIFHEVLIIFTFFLKKNPFVILAMETESVAQEALKKKAPGKRAAARKGKSSLTMSDADDDMDGEEMPSISEDGGDGDIPTVEAPNGKKATAGRKPAKATAKATGTANTRKRGGAQGKNLLSQKLITDVLKPAEKASPEKKVRKMRESPFNKKSGSVLGRGSVSVVESGGSIDSSSSVDLEAELNEVPVARNRPKRENRSKVQYVESGSEEEEEEEDPVTDDSDFEEEEDD